MDVLANVLGITLGNSMLCQSDMQAPWKLVIEANTKTAVHMVRRGICWLRVDGYCEPMRLGPGDVALVARGLRHSLSDPLEASEEPDACGAADNQDPGPRALHTDQQATMLLCAAYEFEQDGQHPLLALLPQLIRLHVDDSEENAEFYALIRLLCHESSQKLAGAEIVVPRLVDSLFVYIVRAWLYTQPIGAAGWFGALRDPMVGRVLGLIHERPDLPWTVAELASKVAMSRAAFARRFVDLVGEPPLKYLTRWRICLAARVLKVSSESVETIAGRVGYDSPTAFGKAFQRHLGVSPGRYRASSAPHATARSAPA